MRKVAVCCIKKSIKNYNLYKIYFVNFIQIRFVIDTFIINHQIMLQLPIRFCISWIIVIKQSCFPAIIQIINLCAMNN